MKKGIYILSALLLVIITALVTYTVTVNQFFGYGNEMETVESVGNKIGEIGAYLDQYAVDELDPVALGDAASEAMIDAIGDKWSYYIPAEEYAAYEERMQNAYVGIGITLVQDEDGRYRVKSVQDGGPAAEAGVLENDFIIAVDGQSTDSMSMEGLKTLVRGEAGTPVTLSLLRGETTVQVTLLRHTIINQIVFSRVTAGKTGYIRIDNFDEHVAEQTIAGVKDVIAKGARRIIFDVRRNPGGYQSELVKILDYLLPEGILFKMVTSDGEEKTEVSDANCISMPMAVLVDSNSYSAAEFFAAALQEYHWATVVGEKTTGKGKYQSLFHLSDGSAINFSIGKYYTPSGKNLSDEGVTPDVTITMTKGQVTAFYSDQLPVEADPQFLAAVAAVSSLPE